MEPKAKFNFTVDSIKKATCPPERKQIRFMDTQVEALGLRVTPAGSKTFIYYRYLPDDVPTATRDGKPMSRACEQRIGNFPSMSVEQARQAAKAVNNKVDSGKADPREPDKEKLTYGALFRQYISEYAKLHTKTWADAEYNHRRYFERFDNLPVASITRQDVQAWINHVREEFGPASATRNYNTLRAVWSWGLRKDKLKGENPCIGVDTFKIKARERFVQPGDEFIRFAQSLEAEPNETIRDFFWMCLYTGQRWGNVCAMEWSQISFELMTWQIPDTKNGDSQNIPLTVNAMEIIRRRKDEANVHERWVFPSDRKGRTTGVLGHLVSPKKAWARILERAGIENLRIHDLRRTAGSYMAIQGVSTTIIGKALGHRSSAATAIYARLTQDPVRQALENAQAALSKPERLLTKEAEVAPIKKANKG